MGCGGLRWAAVGCGGLRWAATGGGRLRDRAVGRGKLDFWRQPPWFADVVRLCRKVGSRGGSGSVIV